MTTKKSVVFLKVKWSCSLGFHREKIQFICFIFFWFDQYLAFFSFCNFCPVIYLPCLKAACSSPLNNLKFSVVSAAMNKNGLSAKSLNFKNCRCHVTFWSGLISCGVLFILGHGRRTEIVLCDVDLMQPVTHYLETTVIGQPIDKSLIKGFGVWKRQHHPKVFSDLRLCPIFGIKPLFIVGDVGLEYFHYLALLIIVLLNVQKDCFK